MSRYNLIHEKWIPVSKGKKASLIDIFEDHTISKITGNPVEKISIFKLLLAIAQDAKTPSDENEWKQLGYKNLSSICVDYLDANKDLFYLYHDTNPFLQMPQIKGCRKQPMAALLPYISKGNTTVLTEKNIQRYIQDDEKALILLTQMGFSLGGKKADSNFTLSEKKEKTAPAGSHLDFKGFLHHFIEAENIAKTIWINLLTQDDIQKNKNYTCGVGVAPWIVMPSSENCIIAKSIKSSYIGSLIPMNRFLLIDEQEVFYTDGIRHLNYKSGMLDNFVGYDTSKKDIKVFWTSPDKQPWRELTSLLSFVYSTGLGFQVKSLNIGIQRATQYCEEFDIYSGGLSVSSNAGEQYVSGSNKDGYVSSSTKLSSPQLSEEWFIIFKNEMEFLDKASKVLYSSVSSYYRQNNSTPNKIKQISSKASSIYWKNVEHYLQDILDASGDFNDERQKEIRKITEDNILTVYSQFCPKDTSRQLDSWIKNKPKIK